MHNLSVLYRWISGIILITLLLLPLPVMATRTIGVYGDKTFDRIEGKIEVTDDGRFGVWLSEFLGEQQDVVVTNLSNGEMRVIAKTFDPSTFIHLSTDNRTVAILYGFLGYKIELYDIPTGALKGTLEYERVTVSDRFTNGDFLIMAFINTQGTNEFLRLNPVTGNLTSIPTTRQPCFGCFARLSPNNQWILYGTATDEDVVIPADGGNAVVLSPPLGTGLRIWENEPNTLYSRADSQPGVVYRYNLFTGAGNPLSGEAIYSDHLGISPDGRYLFYSDRLYVVRLEIATGSLVRLYTIPHNHTITHAVNVAPGWIWVAVRSLIYTAEPAVYMRVSYDTPGIVETVGGVCGESDRNFLFAPSGDYAIYIAAIDGHCYLAASQLIGGVPNVIYPTPVFSPILWDNDYQNVIVAQRTKLSGNRNASQIVRVPLDGSSPKTLLTLPVEYAWLFDVSSDNAIILGSYTLLGAGNPWYVIQEGVGDITISTPNIFMKEGEYATIKLHRTDTSSQQTITFTQGDHHSYILEHTSAVFLAGESEASIRVFAPPNDEVTEWRTYSVWASNVGEGSINGDPYLTITTFDERRQQFLPLLHADGSP